MVTKMRTILLVLTTLGYAVIIWDGVSAEGESLRLIPSEEGPFTRLVNGNRLCSGRVELFRKYQWVTFCDFGWDLREADVVCQDVGCGLGKNVVYGAAFGRGTGNIRVVQCGGQEASLGLCPNIPNSDPSCTHGRDVGVECTGPPAVPTLSLLSPHYMFSVGETVHFSCYVLSEHHISDFNLYKKGVTSPLVTQRLATAKASVELTLSNLDTAQQGGYSCQYRFRGASTSSFISSPLSNYIYITVVDLFTPENWYNTSMETPAGSVLRGHSFNITCSTQQPYPGGSFQLRLVRSNGTVSQWLPALTSFATFTFPDAQNSNEGYYYCRYKVQQSGRIFMSRESQPLPISVIDPDPLVSRVVISWIVSAVTFLVALVSLVVIMHWKREKKPLELERKTRTCVDNTYVAVALK